MKAIFNEILKEKAISLNKGESNAGEILREMSYLMKRSKKKNEWINEYTIEEPQGEMNINNLGKIFQRQWESMFSKSVVTSTKIFDQRMQKFDLIVKEKKDLEKQLDN